MEDMNLEDHELAELLTLTRTVSKMGVIRYKNHLDQLHRVHGPALIWFDGEESWYRYGKRHREDGPAVEWPNGERAWWLNGTCLTEAEWRRITQSCAKI